MGEWTDWIGRKQTRDDVLTPAMLQRFRATIDSAETGEMAPQAIYWCLCLPEAATSELGEDGHPMRTEGLDSFLPPVPLPRRMWASSKVAFIAPISVGAEIRRTSEVAALSEKSGGSGTLVFVEIDHDTFADGMHAVRERQTVVYRAATTEPATPAPPAVAVDLSAYAWSRTLTPSEPLLFRYSALTFNSHRIHYDAPYAVNVERYRGLVVHGPLTATLLLDLAARNLAHNRLKTFSFRGVAPAFAGEALHLAGTIDGDKVVLTALGHDGRTVMVAEGGL